MGTVNHVYNIYINATPERVWRAITDGDETVRYYYGTRVASSWEAGAPLTYTYPDGSVAADGEVLEIDPGRSVTMSFHPRWDPQIEAEGPVRMTWTVEPAGEDGGRDQADRHQRARPGFAHRRRVLRWRRVHRVRAQDLPRDGGAGRG